MKRWGLGIFHAFREKYRWRQATEAIDLAEESLRLSERSYRIGELSAPDLIQEKRHWADLLAAEREALGDLALARAAW